jgi:ribosomal protein S18 acetylase RimI-like enzyme
MWKVLRLHDKSQLLAFLEADRHYGAYAIGDLEPGLFEQCEWFGAARAAGAGDLGALALCFRGLTFPALLLLGDSGGLGAILEAAVLPRYVWLTCLPGHLAMTCDFYVWKATKPMWRMVLRPAGFSPARAESVRLSMRDCDRLAELYALGGGEAFGPSQLERGVFYGICDGGRLAAVAGTHLVSTTYGVAAIGNVFTRPDCRGRGYARAATSAVVVELLDRGIRDIVLNVDETNGAATGLYERLGFARHCAFLEGPAAARTQAGPGVKS